MSRNPEIEQILEAWWLLSHWSAPSEVAASRDKLNKLLDAVVERSGGQFTRDQILDYLWPQFKAYRLERCQRERIGVAQSAFKK